MTTDLDLKFLVGRKTTLRPFSKEDLPTLTRWINDPEVRHFLANTMPQTEKQESEWYEKLGKDDKNIVLAINTREGELIGTMGLHQINWVHRHATTGALIGEKKYWGNGYGSDAKMALLDYAFNTLNLNRISSDVVDYNERSLKYSLRCGYQIEGRRRDKFWRDGRYWDIIELGLLRDEWMPIWQKYKETGSLK